MFDQPPHQQSPSTPSPLPFLIRSTARPTPLRIEKAASTGRFLRQLGVGLGGLAFLAAVGWMALGDPLQHILRGRRTAPPSRLVSALDAYPESGTPMPDSPAADDSQAASVPEAEAGPAIGLPEPARDEAPPSPVHETSVRLKKGDTFAGVLHALGLAAEDVANATAALAPQLSLDRLPVGQTMQVELRPAPDAKAKPVLLGLTIRPEAGRQLSLERDDDGDYSVEEKSFAVAPKLRRAAGTVEDSVIASAESAGVPRAALAEMLHAFSWDVNFEHDIKPGDRFDVLVEQSWTEDGKPVDGGRVLWAALTTDGGEQTRSVYRFKPHDGAEFFYNGEGESVVKSLLRTPLNMSRISSRFGLRRHPLLGFTRLHAGIDFAAPSGTPVLAAGDGRVAEAGLNGGYGRWVEINHGNGLATGYAHLSRIAPGVRRSARVRQGEVIGFVGSTGLSTGPHLHFELHRDGRPVNPLDVAGTAERARLVGEDLARFKERVVEIDEARDSAPEME